MSSAEPQVVVARAAVARVLGIDPLSLRADSPLVPLGWDSLACICWADAVGEAGWRCDAHAASRAASVSDLADCLTPDGSPR